MDRYTKFSKEALKAQDGKKVPLTSEPGGPVIGEVTMKYDPKTGDLMGDFVVTDPEAARILKLSGGKSVLFRSNEES